MNIQLLAEKMRRALPPLSIAASMLAAAAIPAHAQSFSALYEFPNNGGLGSDLSQMSLIQATDGNFYGTTFAGGDYANYSGGAGTIFKVTPAGQLTQLWAFSCAQGGVCSGGRSPEGGVVQANDGNFYGTTYAGGTYNDGTIYRITSDGTLTTLYNFCWYPNTCSPYSGGAPNGGLIQASNGDLYGTTTAGTAFKISTKGKFKLLYTWSAGGSAGALLQIADGNLYGTTFGGGSHGEGTAFRMSLAGKVTTLYSFCAQSHCADGAQPQAGLVVGAKGDLYGTTVNGGTGYGTVFKITRSGTFNSLVSFEAGTTPANPYAPLVLGSDGNLYGTTAYGGEPGNGFVFQIANDTLANAYPLTGNNGCIGGTPYGGLLQSTNGSFYGSDDNGDCADDGTLFQFANDLGPFVQPIPAYGKPTANIIIQGTNLTGTTKVSFHGTSAAFTVVSAGEIDTTVPSGATSGKVEVVTPGGRLKSNVSFKIVQ